MRVGIGDDCAVLRVPRGHELAVTTDMLLETVHFGQGLALAGVRWASLPGPGLK